MGNLNLLPAVYDWGGILFWVGVAVVLLQLAYMLLLLSIGYTCWKADRHQGVSSSENTAGAPWPGISIVVPIRNEARYLPTLLESLSKLDYPEYEVIIVDDHSTDDSAEVVRGRALFPVRYSSLPDGMQGKKMALTHGITQCKYELIACTDGDCKVSRNWLREIAGSYRVGPWDFCAMPVLIEGNVGILAEFQRLEFAGMTGFIQYGIVRSWFYLANGGNMAFTKTAFEESGGFGPNLQVPSGDDVFLVNSIAAKRRSRVAYLSSSRVRTLPVDTLGAFVRQRLRWGGKNTRNPSWIFQLMLLGIGLANGAVLLGAILALWLGSRWCLLLGGAIALKFAADYLYLSICMKKNGMQWGKMYYFPVVWGMNTLYIALLGPLSLLKKKTRWKGREIKTSG